MTETCDWPDENGQICGATATPGCHGFCWRCWCEVGL